MKFGSTRIQKEVIYKIASKLGISEREAQEVVELIANAVKPEVGKFVGRRSFLAGLAGVGTALAISPAMARTTITDEYIDIDGVKLALKDYADVFTSPAFASAVVEKPEYDPDHVYAWKPANNYKGWWLIARGKAGLDDAKVIQSAVNTVASVGGGKILIKAGVYVISSPIYLKSFVALEGEKQSRYGTGGTILKATDELNDYMIQNTETIQSIAIKNLGFDGNKANQTAGGIIKLVDVHVGWIENCSFWKAYEHAIWLGENTGSFWVVKNWITEAGGDGVHINYGDNHIIANEIGMCGSHGLAIYGQSNEIIGGHYWNNGAYGITVGADLNRLIGVRADYNTKGGIILVEASYCSLQGCHAYNNNQGNGDRSGIELYNSTYNTITGCVAIDTQSTKTQEYGIKETGTTSDYNNIANNIVTPNKAGGVSTYGINTVVANNI